MRYFHKNIACVGGYGYVNICVSRCSNWFNYTLTVSSPHYNNLLKVQWTHHQCNSIVYVDKYRRRSLFFLWSPQFICNLSGLSRIRPFEIASASNLNYDFCSIWTHFVLFRDSFVILHFVSCCFFVEGSNKKSMCLRTKKCVFSIKWRALLERRKRLQRQCSHMLTMIAIANAEYSIDNAERPLIQRQRGKSKTVKN